MDECSEKSSKNDENTVTEVENLEKDENTKSESDKIKQNDDECNDVEETANDDKPCMYLSTCISTFNNFSTPQLHYLPYYSGKIREIKET